MTLPVSVEDVYLGKTVEAKFVRQAACDKCRGTGADTPKSLKPCTQCRGEGFTIQDHFNHYGQKFVGENTCQACQGWGKQITKNCPVCNGKKIVEK